MTAGDRSPQPGGDAGAQGRDVTAHLGTPADPSALPPGRPDEPRGPTTGPGAAAGPRGDIEGSRRSGGPALDPAPERDSSRTSGSGRGTDRPGPGGRAHRIGRRSGRGSFARELPFLVLVAFLLALLIKAFLVQAFWIPSGSMERTLLINDRVLVNKVVYRFRDVHRGEIVVFNGDGTGFQRAEAYVKPPSNAFERVLRNLQNLLGLGAPSDKDFIKRVIGVGGDTVQCCDTAGRVTVNGGPLQEPYVFDNSPVSGGPTARTFGPVKVPEGQLWVMGDHRGESADSRVNGTVPESKVVGRAFVRVWPVSRVALLRVPSTLPRTSSGASDLLGDTAWSLAAALTLPVALVDPRRRGAPPPGPATASRQGSTRRFHGRRRPGRPP